MTLDTDFIGLLADVQTAGTINKTTAYAVLQAVCNHPQWLHEMGKSATPNAYVTLQQNKGV